MVNKLERDVFYKSGLLTLVIFLLGIIVGYWLDNFRVEEIKQRLTEMDISWNDARIQSLYHQTFIDGSSEFCDSAISANYDFNRKIYSEGQRIEKYEEANKFAPSLILEKKRYALLQLQFWLNSIHLKKQCNTNYSTIVYFYSHFKGELKLQQRLQSSILLDVAEECDIILVPLPLDLDITTIETIKQQYNINSAPSLLIDEETVLEGVRSSEEIKRYINC